MNIAKWHEDNDASLPFEIGEYVRVKYGLEDNTYAAYRIPNSFRCPESDEILHNMQYYQGAVTRVTDVLEDGRYTILADGCRYIWHKDLLERAEKEDMQNNKLLIVGSKVRVVPNLNDLVKAGKLKEDDVHSGILPYEGKVAVINRIATWDDTCDLELEIDDGNWWWPPAALIPITENEWWRETKTKIAPGARVRIKSDLIVDMEYDDIVATDTMVSEYAGKTAWVTKVDDDSDFKIDIDRNTFWWSMAMVDIIER